ncbi:uncharacterized protein Z519_07560 [Cladophialophora bantiana CBS 173.52]|uniref:guanosine-diphosphatase n=1 Tax=Cladophialophora bantiana (strain ATCC 10958 / CBS 173.52 / CDC B-1940 / NIH 8579) TaxID=1442370 RepID=A0A0D2HE83_CLAB1|nr:uncharacterized protein Z519_07560 [Cladophialophora bantiana CBS 173.52]KIW91593.1 hypothetical protein Z519_07560 [Cladophialophora bantiana CBS 173.52]
MRSLPIRFVKICSILAIIIYLSRLLTRENASSYSAGFNAGHIPAKATTTQCTKPHDATKPLDQYTVMIDAGGTGSRVHVYKFNNRGPTPELENEDLKITKKLGRSSLGSYTDAEETAERLDPLIQSAQSSVPEDLLSCKDVVRTLLREWRIGLNVFMKNRVFADHIEAIRGNSRQFRGNSVSSKGVECFI